jgi:serine phosphatase RsbU (regulator of sigma subunit)
LNQELAVANEALVLSNVALHEGEERYRQLAKENERLYRQQLAIAEGLQLALLDIPSQIGHVKLGHIYRSATEAAHVGGDFYDVFEVKGGGIAVLIGDVAGHGIQAARTATLVKDVVHAFAHQSLRTHEVLRRTNGLLIEKELPGFVTLFLGIIDPETGHLRYSCAGHPESLLRRASGEVERLGSGTSPLGVYPDAVWKPHAIDLEAGDILVLNTDGVIEARRNGQFFGEKRLDSVVKRRPASPERLPKAILDQVLAFSEGSLHDDVAILAVMLTDKGNGGRAKAKPFKQEKLLGS